MVKIQLTPEQLEEKKKKQEEEKKQKQAEKEKKKQEEKDKENSKPATSPEDSVYKQVKYEGKTVVEVLQQGHTDTHYHCKMSDSSTMHVPRSEFK